MKEELLTIVAAAAPISELRGAIPLGLSFGFSPLKAYLLAVLGNGLIVAPVLLFLYRGSDWLMARSKLMNRFLAWLFERTRRRHADRFTGVGLAALAVFVAVPLPMTGAWTAALIAFLFDMPLRRSFIAILIGVLVAGLVVVALSMGIIAIW